MAVTFFEPAYLVNEYSEHRLVSPVRSSIVLLRCRKYRLPLRFGRRSGGFFVQQRTEINQYPCQDKSVFLFLFFTTTAAERPRNRTQPHSAAPLRNNPNTVITVHPPQHIAPAELLENTGCRKMTMYLSR